MIVGWAINSAMILLAAATFFKGGIQVEELQQAKSLLDLLLGSSAGVVFALALLMAGISSTITSGMAAGSSLPVSSASRTTSGTATRRWGGNPVVGHRAAVDLFYRRPVQGTADFADDTEHPVAVYGVPAGEPHLVPQSDGAVCEQ